MEKITTQQNDRLLDLLDGKLSGVEAAVLKKQLAESATLRQRLEELRIVHTFLTDKASLTVPDLALTSFTNRVMNNLDHMPSGVSSSALSPRNGLLLLLGILVATGIGMVLLATGSMDTLSGLINLNDLKLPNAVTTLSIKSIPLSMKTVMKIFILINLLIAFIVLDRTVLKPYFNRKHSTQK